MAEYFTPPYEQFKAAFDEIRKALFKLAVDKNYEDAVFVPAMISVAANLSVLADNTDEELIEQFKNCLLDARTRNLQRKESN